MEISELSLPERNRYIQTRLALFGINRARWLRILSCLRKESGDSEEKVINDLIKLFQTIEEVCTSSNVELKDYQQRVVRYMHSHRGVILSFATGRGKTLTAIAISECILQTAAVLGIEDLRVVVVTPASLVDNFRKEIRKYGVYKESKYEIYTTQKFAKDYANDLINMEKSILIVDEAHELRTDYRGIFGFAIKKNNLEARAKVVIDAAKQAWRTILLTATPIFNRTYDVLNLVAMVKGTDPLNTEEFGRTLEDENLFRNYFGCIFSFEKEITNLYPSRVDKVTYITMNNAYYRKYMEVEEKIMESFSGDEGDEGKYNSQAFMIAVRTASNSLKPFLKGRIIEEIVDEGRKTLIYSNFLDAGIDLVKEMLDRKGIDYLEITGRINKAKRQGIVNQFNDPNGPLVLVITQAGTVGLDLKGTRNVIIMEPYWNDSLMEQIVGRGVRLGSHLHLPPSERNVNVYYLILVKPEDARELERRDYEPLIKLDHKRSADLHLWELAKEKDKENQLLLRRLEEVSLSDPDCF